MMKPRETSAEGRPTSFNPFDPQALAALPYVERETVVQLVEELRSRLTPGQLHPRIVFGQARFYDAEQALWFAGECVSRGRRPPPAAASHSAFGTVWIGFDLQHTAIGAAQ